MLDTFSIRPAEAGDEPSVRQILAGTNLGAEDLANHFANFFVALTRNRIVGTIGLELYGSQGVLRSAAVLPSHEGKGIGRELVLTIEGSAARHGVKELYLLTTTAEKYFARRGFTVIDRTQVVGRVLESIQFRGACPSTAVVMKKLL